MKALDCIVVGAGQSGLCAAKLLADSGVSYIVLEKSDIGGAWLNRPAEMRLFTSRQFCGLPGMDFPGNRSGFPLVDEMASYLKAYAHNFSLHIQENTTVINVVKNKDIFEVSTLSGETLSSKTLINATGSNQVCIVPDIAKGLSESVVQYQAERCSFDDIPYDSRVLVVGDGASGRQIAGGLAARCKSVTLSVGAKRGLPPNTLLGKDIFWWLKKLGILFADKNSLIAKILKRRNPVPCRAFNNSKLNNLGVDIKPRTVSCSENRVSFSDDSSIKIDTVVWSIGYRDETRWLSIDSCINDRGFKGEYGATPEPGVYILGRKWLSCRASELILGVERDAKIVISKLHRYLEGIS